MVNASRSALGVLLVGIAWSPPLGPQQRLEAQGSHITIPSLANATKPGDLEFEAGECDVDAAGQTMRCRFQQVFLTQAAFDAHTCLITTNRYERTFQKETSGAWVSSEGPDGICGVVDSVTLRQESPARWTMEARKIATSKDAARACPSDTLLTLSWKDVRRTLTCTFVQPGAMSE